MLKEIISSGTKTVILLTPTDIEERERFLRHLKAKGVEWRFNGTFHNGHGISGYKLWRDNKSVFHFVK